MEIVEDVIEIRHVHDKVSEGLEVTFLDNRNEETREAVAVVKGRSSISADNAGNNESRA